MAVQVNFPFCSYFLFFVVLVSGSIMKDPLQPVWDGIEELPAKILNEITKILTNKVAEINEKSDVKTESVKTVLAPALQSLVEARSKAEAAEGGVNLNEKMINSLTDAFETFYKTRMKPEEEAAFEASNTISSLEETESKVTRHINHMLRKSDFLFEFNATLEDHIFEITHNEERRQLSLRNLDDQVNEIRMRLTTDETDVCSPALHDFLRFITYDVPSEQRLKLAEGHLNTSYKLIVEELPSVFYRDCSDILNLRPQSSSGVYDIYPTGDSQKKVSVWCDMETKRNEDSPSGWTVMLRRRNTSAGLLDFNRTWDEYAEGFGIPGEEGEWWLGLNWVHQLTYHQPYELMFLLRDIDSERFKVYYSLFVVEDESKNFQLRLGGYKGTIVDAFGSFHHGQLFSTADRDNDLCDCNCALNNLGGWWYNKCHRTVLTASFPQSDDRAQKTIRWLTTGDYLSGHWLVLDDVTMMLKPL